MSNLGKNDPRCYGVGCSIRDDCSRYVAREEPSISRHSVMFTKGYDCFFFVKEEKQDKEKLSWE